MLDSAAHGKRLPEKNLLILGSWLSHSVLVWGGLLKILRMRGGFGYIR